MSPTEFQMVADAIRAQLGTVWHRSHMWVLRRVVLPAMIALRLVTK